MNRDDRKRINVQFAMVLVLGLCCVATATQTVQDVLAPAPPGTVQVSGWLGRKLEVSLHHHVMVQDLARIIKPFRDRTEENSGHWRCEYWGKWFTSAALGYAYQPTDAHRKVLDRGIEALVATQTPDGYIGTYKPECHLGIWDVWGRKYTLLGLRAHYDLTGDRQALTAARRLADHLLKEAPPGRFNLTENGIDVLKGLPSSSILEPIALLYQRTGDGRYLELANDIVNKWSKPNKFFANGSQLLEKGLGGTPPTQIGARKAYEMMSCFEGVCEMYRITGQRRYLDAVVAFAQSIRRNELMIHGSGSNQELWCEGTRVQTESLEQPTETCVTVTWMKLCYQLLRLTGDPLWADELEVSLYNALTSAMTPDGAWWAYFSPLAGQRVPSHYQHSDVQLSCCVANGPRGLLLTPRWAVMESEEGLVVNLYSPGSATLTLANGVGVEVIQKTDYPVGNEIVLTVSPAVKTRFTLSLRIPGWSQRTSLTINGQPIVCKPGSYAEVTREWSPGDKVILTLDLRGRAVPAPSGAPQLAIMRGPIVLALDDRLAKPENLAVRLVTDEDGFVALRPSPSKPEEIWMAFDAPFEVRPTHYFGHYKSHLTLCDYASAGNGWSSENLFRVWLPQPLFLRQMYPTETWRLMCPDLQECPRIPKFASEVGHDLQPGKVSSPVELQLVGDWAVEARVAGVDGASQEICRIVHIEPPAPVAVVNEPYASLEEWKPDQPGWARRQLRCLEDGLYTSRLALVPGSVRVTSADQTREFASDKDFKVDLEWGGLGRLREGSIGSDQSVLVSYRFMTRRIDSLALTVQNHLVLRQGHPHLATPHPPELLPGERRLANLWLPAHLTGLTADNLFPILVTAFPEASQASPTPAERLLPKTLAKLRKGQPLTLVAWGDSVTEGYLGEDQWQAQFVRRLQGRFPKAKIRLVTVGWGAHNSLDFLEAPSGHIRNFSETVLGVRPDLVVSEFVNDGPVDPARIEAGYCRVLAEFHRIGAEWIILTPHYNSFMALPRERDIDKDPRAYVGMVRRFTAAHGVALADAAERYGRLWRQGIPFSTLMVNAANHPDARGMAIFADSLMALFP